MRDIFDIVEEMAPPSLAEDWDNCGLQVGNPEEAVRGIVIALDPSPEAVDWVSNIRSNLLLTHHPLFISGIKSIDTGSGPGVVVKSAIEKGITIFSAHTNLDSAKDGVNDMLSSILGMKEILPIEPSSRNNSEGLGRIGNLPQRIPIRDVVGMIKERLGVETVKVAAESMDREVGRIAICGGSGGDLMEKAVEQGAELFISGDIRYHQARRAVESGIAAIDAGHFGTEFAAVKTFAKAVEKKLGDRGIEVPVSLFEMESDPFRVV